MKKINKNIMFVIALFAITFALSSTTYGKANYTIGHSQIKSVCKKNYRTIQNKNTRASLGINFYIEKIRKSGGGTLTIKKGKYLISNSIYIPSNIKIVLKDGVTFKKISKTGVYYPASASMWQFVPQLKSKKKNAISKYNGSKNIKIQGKGKVIIDMSYTTGHGMILAHNSNVKISGITFKGMNGNHYIEVNSSKKVTIKNCKFQKAKKSNLSTYFNKEAINIDSADASTNSIPVVWVKKDKTCCKDVTIEKCTFDGMGRAIGTHKYSQKSNGTNLYHTNIIVRNNKMTNIYNNGVYIMNWKNTVITGNTFYNIGNECNMSFSAERHAIAGGGVLGIKITDNYFEKINRSIAYFCMRYNKGDSSNYEPIRVYITKDEAKLMLNNKKKNCGYDDSETYKYCDFLYFKGDSNRNKEQAVGVSLTKKKIINSF